MQRCVTLSHKEMTMTASVTRDSIQHCTCSSLLDKILSRVSCEILHCESSWIIASTVSDKPFRQATCRLVRPCTTMIRDFQPQIRSTLTFVSAASRTGAVMEAATSVLAKICNSDSAIDSIPDAHAMYSAFLPCSHCDEIQLTCAGTSPFTRLSVEVSTNSNVICDICSESSKLTSSSATASIFLPQAHTSADFPWLTTF